MYNSSGKGDPCWIYRWKSLCGNIKVVVQFKFPVVVVLYQKGTLENLFGADKAIQCSKVGLVQAYSFCISGSVRDDLDSIRDFKRTSQFSLLVCQGLGVLAVGMVCFIEELWTEK